MTNHLPAGAPANRYLVLRHGRSLANEAGIIVSDPVAGRRAGTGLSSAGRRQVRAAVSAVAGLLGPSTVIVSSPLSRAVESATIACSVLAAGTPALDDRLRERYFGQLDGGPDSAYPAVWAADARDSTTSELGVEPADDVLDRTTALVADLERRHCGATILLVAHGDVLQILECAFGGLDAGSHRQLDPLPTAGIRALCRRG